MLSSEFQAQDISRQFAMLLSTQAPFQKAMHSTCQCPIGDLGAQYSRPPVLAKSFQGVSLMQLTMEIVNGRRPAIPRPEELLPVGGPPFEGLDAYIDLMQRCWAQDSEERPAFGAIVADLRCAWRRMQVACQRRCQFGGLHGL